MVKEHDPTSSDAPLDLPVPDIKNGRYQPYLPAEIKGGEDKDEGDIVASRTFLQKVKSIAHGIIDPNDPVVFAALLALQGECLTIFKPNYVPAGLKKYPFLKHPHECDLKGFEELDLPVDINHYGKRRTVEVTAWYKPAKTDPDTGKKFPTIVYFHGAWGGLDLRAPQIQSFSERGFGVIAATYPGLKHHKRCPRPKVYPIEDDFTQTGHAVVKYLLEHGVPLNETVLFGESLGSFMATKTALELQQGKGAAGGESMNVASVICWAPAPLHKRAKEQYPWMLPLRNRFAIDEVMPQIDYDKTRVLLMAGKKDPYTHHTHSDELHKLSGEKADIIKLKGCNHGLTITPESHIKDPVQMKQFINCAQDYLNGLGLCPPSPPESVVDVPVDSDGKPGHADRLSRGDDRSAVGPDRSSQMRL